MEAAWGHPEAAYAALLAPGALSSQAEIDIFIEDAWERRQEFQAEPNRDDDLPGVAPPRMQDCDDTEYIYVLSEPYADYPCSSSIHL